MPKAAAANSIDAQLTALKAQYATIYKGLNDKTAEYKKVREENLIAEARLTRVRTIFE